MAIKETANYDIEKVFKEFGHDYSDFIKYMKNNSSSTPVMENEQYSATYVVNEFISNIEKDNLLQIKSSDTVKYYLSFLYRFNNFLNENHKEKLFLDLNEKVFYNFVEHTNRVNNSPLAQSSINTYISIVRKVCTFAVENDYVTKNINYKFNKISYTKLPRYFSNQQLHDLFNVLNKHKNAYLWRPIFTTLLGTGLRVHELAAIQIKDIDIKNKLLFTLGKGKKERYVPIYVVHPKS